jgi:hypothetical protein
VQYMFQGEPEREAWAFPPVLTSHHVIRAHRACRTPPAGLLQLSDCARSLTASSASANDPGGPVSTCAVGAPQPLLSNASAAATLVRSLSARSIATSDS